MNYNELKEQINKDDIANVYLFEGEEEYLQEFGTALIKSKVITNDEFDVHMIEGSQCIDKIESIIDTFPLFNKNKFIVVRNSELFTIAGNSRVESLIEKIDNIGSSTYIIFREIKTDRNPYFISVLKSYAELFYAISKMTLSLLNG
jgi:DNA polymerase III delta subunit